MILDHENACGRCARLPLRKRQYPFGLGKRAVDLVELIEDPILLITRMLGSVSVAETVKWPLRAPAAMLTRPASVNLMGHGNTSQSQSRVHLCSLESH